MTGATIEHELLELERQFWQALKDKDVETALLLTDDPCIIAGAQGVNRIDKAEFAEMVRASNFILNKFELKDGAQVRMLSHDVAILAYKVREELTVDGRSVVLDAADSSTWVRRKGRWVCAMHTESLAGDPYGRDRRIISHSAPQTDMPDADL